MATNPSSLIQQLLSPQAINGFQQGQQSYQDRQTQNAANQQALQLGQMKIQQAQAQQAKAQAYQSDVQSYFKNPKPEALAGLVAKYPDQADALKQSYDIMDAPAKESRLTQFGQLYSASSTGRSDLAGQQLDNIIAAEQAKGIVDKDATDLRDAVKAGDPSALTRLKAFSQIHLAAASPEFAKSLGIGVKGDQDEYSNTPQGVIYSKRTGEAKGGGLASGAGGPAGVAPTTLPDIADRIGSIEGTGQNPSSSASGYGQFTNSTWLSTFKTQNPNSGLTDAQILAQRSNPDVAKQMLGALTGQNAQTLQSAGIQPTAGNIYLAHFLGAGGAVSLLHADPSTPVSQILSPAAIKANPSILGGQTAGQVQAWANQKITSGVANSGASATQDPGLLNDGAIGDMIAQYKAGDKTVLQGLGRGKQGAQNIVKFRNMLHDDLQKSGVTGADLAANMAEYQGDVAAQRTAGNRMAQVDLSANEFKRLAPIALRTSNILDRVGWLPLAKVQQSIRNGTNNPQYRAFNAANTALVNTYARAISPSGQPTVADKQHGFDLLNTAFDKPSYEAVVNQMQQEVDAALKAPHDVRASLRAAVAGSSAHAAPAIPTDVAAILKKYGH